MPSYYIKRDKKIKGPFEKSQLRELLKSGKLQPTDQVREGQSGTWTSLEDFLAKPKGKSKGKGKSKQKTSTPIGLIAAGGAGVCLLIAAGVYFSGLLGTPEKVPNVAENSDTPREVDLLPLLNVEDYSIVGAWTQEDESLVSPKGNGVRIQIPYAPPEEYELICEIEPLEPVRGIAIGLISSGNPFHAILGYRGQNGLEQVDGGDIYRNATRSTEPLELMVGQKSTIRCIVKKSSVQVNVDNKTIIDWQGAPKELSRNGYWKIPFDNALWFGGFSQYKIHSASLKPITGKGISLLDQLPPRIVSESAQAKAEKIYGPALGQLVKLIGVEKQPLKIQLSYSGKPVLYFDNKNIAKLTPELLDLITHLQGPVTLNLYQMNVADDAMTIEHFNSLGQMPKLFGIGLWNRHLLDGPRMQALAKSKSLGNIVLDYQSMPEDEIAALCEMKTLVRLQMRSVGLNDKNLYSVATSLPQLEYLDVRLWSKGKPITEKTLTALSQLSKLKYLNISECPGLNDDAVQHLSKMKNLETLVVNKTRISFSGAKSLKNSLSQTSVSWEMPPVVIQPDQTVPILELIEKFPNDKPLFDRQLAEARRSIERFAKSNRTGHVVVGRIKIKNGDKPTAIRSQVQISDEGFFVSAIRDASKPMGFQAHQYLPLKLIISDHAELNDDGIYDVGVIPMTQAPPERLGSVVGQIQLEGRESAKGATARLSFVTIAVNSLSGGTQGGSRNPLGLTSEPQANGKFTFEELSEGKYFVSFSREGYVSDYRSFQVQPGETTDLGTISLDRKRDVEIEYLVEQNPFQQFDLSRKQTVTVKTGEAFKSRDDIYGNDLRIISRKRAILFQVNYAPCSIMDLGKGELIDFANYNIDDFKGVYPNGLTPKIGHVYLLNQGHWKHFVLFRINSIDGKTSQEADQPKPQVMQDSDEFSEFLKSNTEVTKFLSEIKDEEHAEGFRKGLVEGHKELQKQQKRHPDACLVPHKPTASGRATLIGSAGPAR